MTRAFQNRQARVRYIAPEEDCRARGRLEHVLRRQPVRAVRMRAHTLLRAQTVHSQIGTEVAGRPPERSAPAFKAAAERHEHGEVLLVRVRRELAADRVDVDRRFPG